MSGRLEEGDELGLEPHPARRRLRRLLRTRERAYAAFFLAAGTSVRTPMMSLSFMIKRSSPSSTTSVPDHLPNSTRSPTLTSIGISLPLSSRPPGPTAVISPCDGFSLAVSGMMIPPLVFSSASIRLTTTRSCSGRNLDLAMTVPFRGSFSDLVCDRKQIGKAGVFVTAKRQNSSYPLAIVLLEC